MNKQNQIKLSSLAMDLKRAALGYHHGSISTTKRFLDEAIKPKNEIDSANVKPYIKKILGKIDSLKNETDTSRIAEDAIMYTPSP